MMGTFRFLLFFLGAHLASGNELNGPSRFSCLNDGLSLRALLVDQYSLHMGGHSSEQKRFRDDHEALKNFLRPAPYFPADFIQRVDFYQDKLIPALKYFKGLQVVSANKSVRKVRKRSLEFQAKKQIKSEEYIDARGESAWVKRLRGMDAQRFYRFIFSQAKSDLVLMKQLPPLPSTPVVSVGHLSDRYQSFSKDEERGTYFSLCATLFESDAIQSSRPSIQSGPRRQIPRKSSQSSEDEEIKRPGGRLLTP